MLVLAAVFTTLLTDTPAADPVRVTTDGSFKQHVQWSPDGKTLLFTRIHQGKMALWTVGVDGKDLKRLLADPGVTKIFHFARFDVAVLYQALGVMAAPVYCTKIASKLARTYTDRHGLKDLCKELLGKDLDKQQQSSDWGARELTQEQLTYAASDVLYLHALKAKLDAMLEREGRETLAQACFDFLPTRAVLDLAGWADSDIFAH